VQERTIDLTEPDLADLKKLSTDLKDDLRAILKVVQDPVARVQLSGEGYAAVSNFSDGLPKCQWLSPPPWLRWVLGTEVG